METSFTFDDVVFCVDTGKVKNLQYSPSRRMTALVEEFVSRAASEQRKGRAGRVQPGQFYALYTRARFERKMRAFTQPEIVRGPLADTCLQLKLLGVGAPAEVRARTVAHTQKNGGSAGISCSVVMPKRLRKCRQYTAWIISL